MGVWPVLLKQTLTLADHAERGSLRCAATGYGTAAGEKQGGEADPPFCALARTTSLARTTTMRPRAQILFATNVRWPSELLARASPHVSIDEHQAQTISLQENRSFPFQYQSC